MHLIGNLKKYFIYFYFSERGWEGERDEEKHLCGEKHQSLPLACAPDGDQAHNPGMGLDQESNLLRFSRGRPTDGAMLARTSCEWLVELSESED